MPDNETLLEAIIEANKLLDDTEVPEPIPIESEEDRRLLLHYILWKWQNSLFW